jgi:hypothetical protein
MGSQILPDPPSTDAKKVHTPARISIAGSAPPQVKSDQTPGAPRLTREFGIGSWDLGFAIGISQFAFRRGTPIWGTARRRANRVS